MKSQFALAAAIGVVAAKRNTDAAFMEHMSKYNGLGLGSTGDLQMRHAIYDEADEIIEATNAKADLEGGMALRLAHNQFSVMT